jgi:hypothetical protein
MKALIKPNVGQIDNPTYTQANSRMEALFNAKNRVRENKQVSSREMPIETEPTPSPDKEVQETLSKPEQSTSTTSALLARKKNLRK